jgi:anti-anti-sigma regulatory factor
MSEEFKIQMDKDGDNAVLKFHGQLDEDADFDQAVNLGSDTIIFDFENVKHINSCGIREWIKFQGEIDSTKKLVYRNCPQIIVEQMNIVKGFVRDGGVIESFYAPYYSEDKDEERKILITPDQVKDGKAPEITEDGETLEFDDIEAQYFNFLKNI